MSLIKALIKKLSVFWSLSQNYVMPVLRTRLIYWNLGSRGLAPSGMLPLQSFGASVSLASPCASRYFATNSVF